MEKVAINIVTNPGTCFPRIAFTFLVLSSVLLSVGCREAEVPAQETPVRPIAWTEVKNAVLEQSHLFTGTTESKLKAPLSFEVPGLVQEVAAVVGQEVEKGDRLAILDARTLELDVLRLENALAETQALFNNAERDLQRRRSLAERGLISRAALDESATQREQAFNRVGQARRQLEVARKQLNDSTLTAPFAGVISERLIEPGQQVAVGQKAFQIEGTGGTEITVLVPEHLISLLARDKEHGVRLPSATASTLTARVSEVGSNALQAGAFPVTLELADHTPIRSGLSAEVMLRFRASHTSGESSALVAVPVSAIILENDENPHVFKYQASGQGEGIVTLQPVALHKLTDAGALLSDGLDEGDIVAIKGVSLLRNQQRVALLGEGARRFNP